jgi:hypothetical protein
MEIPQEQPSKRRFILPLCIYLAAVYKVAVLLVLLCVLVWLKNELTCWISRKRLERRGKQMVDDFIKFDEELEEAVASLKETSRVDLKLLETKRVNVAMALAHKIRAKRNWKASGANALVVRKMAHKYCEPLGMRSKDIMLCCDLSLRYAFVRVVDLDTDCANSYLESLDIQIQGDIF